MTHFLEKLAQIGGTSIRSQTVDEANLSHRFGASVAQSLLSLLVHKNGYYAFEGALHVLSDLGNGRERGLVDWNDDNVWRSDYQGMTEDATFFAEDVFGMQFCIHRGEVATFDPETGLFEPIARDIEEWACVLLGDFRLWTGHQVAHDWQQLHGRIPAGARLVPVIPFALNGEYSVENVRAMDAVESMRYRASIALQIRDLPEGASIKFRVID